MLKRVRGREPTLDMMYEHSIQADVTSRAVAMGQQGCEVLLKTRSWLPFLPAMYILLGMKECAGPTVKED